MTSPRPATAMHVQAVISSTSQRVRVEGLGDLLDKDALHKLATSADADGQVSMAQLVAVLRKEGEETRIDLHDLKRKSASDSKKDEIRRVIEAADVDGDGKLDLSELMAVVKDDVTATFLAKRGHRRVMMLLGVLFFMFCALVGVTFGQGALFKDSYVEKRATPVLSDAQGDALATAENLEAVPLLAAPVLSSEALQRTKLITVSYDHDVYGRVRRSSLACAHPPRPRTAHYSALARTAAGRTPWRTSSRSTAPRRRSD